MLCAYCAHALITVALAIASLLLFEPLKDEIGAAWATVWMIASITILVVEALKSLAILYLIIWHTYVQVRGTSTYGHALEKASM